MISVAEKIGLVEQRVKNISDRLTHCDICPRNCGINRLTGQGGFCGMGQDTTVYTSFLHRGEEPPISGGEGSGTIFFSGCNLCCCYCQNYKFSHLKEGKKTDSIQLANIMLELQTQGARNINFVTPTHFLPQIFAALLEALKKGLSIPLVYNTSSYEKVDLVRQLEGIIDIYLADIRYFNEETAQRYSQAPDYPSQCRQTIQEMYRQKHTNRREVEENGLIIRCLVLPNHTEEAKEILAWIKDNAPLAKISVMFQYQPYFKTNQHPEINRTVDTTEYEEITQFVDQLGLNGWVQDLDAREELAGVYFQRKEER